MPNRQLFDRLNQLEQQVSIQLNEIRAVQVEVQRLIEENHSITMENKHLKDKLDSLTMGAMPLQKAVEKPVQQRGGSFINLEKIYQQGFHICNDEYGKRRNNDETCIFCANILYGDE